MNYVTWVEPSSPEGSGVSYCFLSVDQVVRERRLVHNYPSDEQALDDFITIHWARVITEEQFEKMKELLNAC